MDIGFTNANHPGNMRLEYWMIGFSHKTNYPLICLPVND